jgi:leader peptidase (prepilin peptidase)/N-methyltransferase
MIPVFAIAAAAAVAACGWPACAVVGRLGTTTVSAGATAADAASVREDGPETAAHAQPADTAREPARPGVAAVILISAVLAALAFGVAVRLHPALVAAAGCWLVACGVPLAIIDVRIRRLPDVLTGACLVGMAVLLTVAAGMAGDWTQLARAAGGALAIAASFTVLAVARPGSAGLGDAKLGLSTGLMAAWFGWPTLLWAVFAAFALAACYGVGLIAAGRASVRGSSLPFGPFLLAGCLLMISLGGR